MEKEVFARCLSDVADDYKKYGKRMPVREWFIAAIKRQIIDVSDEDAQVIAADLIRGIKAFRQEKENVKAGRKDYFKSKGCSGEQQAETEAEVEEITQYLTRDMK